LAVGHDLTLVSVGPVGQYPGLSNEEIEGFNSQIKALCEELQIPYVDDYTVLTTEGYETQDGLHYKDAVYERIYQILKQQVEGITS
jgi:lysophospholipase L1-like esterase